MLFRHKEFVKNHLGYSEDNVVLIENGDVLELDGERAAVVDKKEIGTTFIDESGFEEIELDTVKERKRLAVDGILTTVITLDAETGELEGDPEIIAKGVQGIHGSNGLLTDARRKVIEAVETATRTELEDLSLLREKVRLELKRLIQKETGAKPVITPVIVEV
jgi:ribonuclease J